MEEQYVLITDNCFIAGSNFDVCSLNATGMMSHLDSQRWEEDIHRIYVERDGELKLCKLDVEWFKGIGSVYSIVLDGTVLMACTIND